jgi:16S rRNA (guanine966-N2)-methyltransferase
VREALFSRVGQALDGVTVLDAYGGSGLLSFEAISRGAESALLFERDPRTARRIADAARALGLSDRIRVRRGESPRDLPSKGAYGLILLDPPYAIDPSPALVAVAPLAAGVIVLEHAARRAPPRVEGLIAVREKRYGDTALTLYRRSGDGDAPVSR